jgi:hypothetical protein
MLLTLHFIRQIVQATLQRLDGSQRPAIATLLCSPAFAVAMEPRHTSIHRPVTCSVTCEHATALEVATCTHAVHATAMQLWATALGDQGTMDALSSQTAAQVPDDSAPWAALLEHTKQSVTCSAAAVDAALESVSLLASDPVWRAADGPAMVLASLSHSAHGPLTSARAAMAAVAAIMDARHGAMLEELLYVERDALGEGGGGEATGITGTLVHRLVALVDDSVRSLQTLYTDGALTALKETATRGRSPSRSSSSCSKALGCIHELQWPCDTGAGVAKPQLLSKRQLQDSGSEFAAQPAMDSAARAELGEAVRRVRASRDGESVLPATRVRQAMHAHVWQRLVAALEAMLLLRRLAVLSVAAQDGAGTSLGTAVMRLLFHQPRCLLRLESAVERVLWLQGAPPFAYNDIIGAPWGPPALAPWAASFLGKCEGQPRGGAVRMQPFSLCRVPMLVRCARYWAKQVAHNRAKRQGSAVGEA